MTADVTCGSKSSGGLGDAKDLVDAAPEHDVATQEEPKVAHAHTPEQLSLSSEGRQDPHYSGEASRS